MINAGRRSKDALHGDGARRAGVGATRDRRAAFQFSCGHGPSCCLPSLPLPEPFLSGGVFSRDIETSTTAALRTLQQLTAYLEAFVLCSSHVRLTRQTE